MDQGLPASGVKRTPTEEALDAPHSPPRHAPPRPHSPRYSSCPRFCSSIPSFFDGAASLCSCTLQCRCCTAQSILVTCVRSSPAGAHWPTPSNLLVSLQLSISSMLVTCLRSSSAGSYCRCIASASANWNRRGADPSTCKQRKEGAGSHASTFLVQATTTPGSGVRRLNLTRNKQHETRDGVTRLNLPSKEREGSRLPPKRTGSGGDGGAARDETPWAGGMREGRGGGGG